MPLTNEEQEYLKLELGLPNRISLFKISNGVTNHYFCGDFRQEPVWWNGILWDYAPLVIDEYRFSEDNSSITPTLSLVNLAALYSETLASLPALEGYKVTFYEVYETEIKTTNASPQSSRYLGKFSFKLSQLIARNVEKISYRIQPIGFLYNNYAPSRIVLRDGLFNLSFPGAGEKYQS